MTIDLSQFEEIIPLPKPSQLAINITASGYVNLNERLRNKMQLTEVGLRVNKDGTQIILNPKTDNPFKVLKSGSIKAIECTRKLANKGVTLPARYDAEWNEDIHMWVGSLIKPKKASKTVPNNKSKLTKPRTTGLNDMIP